MTTEQIILYGVIALVILAVLWAVFAYAQFYRKEHLHCPKCGHNWKPPVLRMIFSVNAVDGKIMRCPQCGEKEFMPVEKDD